MWGVGWRMPILSDFEELVTKCEWFKIDNDILRVVGPNGNNILLHVGPYWTGEKMKSYEICRMKENNQLIFKFWDRSTYNHLKTYCIIRPVLDKNKV